MRTASLVFIAILVCIKLAFADGPLDPTFGYNGGPYVYSVGVDNAEAVAVAHDTRGHLITVGHSSGGSTELFVVRHNLASPIGVDSNFGPFGNGLANNPFGSINDSGATAVAVDHQDRIVVAGYFQLHRSCGSDADHLITYFAAARFINDGTSQDGYSDSSFGSGLVGATGTMVGDCDLTYAPTSMAIGDHDEVIVGGHDSSGKMALVKWNAAGALDTSFGAGGIVLQDFGGTETAIESLATDSQGRILVAALVLTHPSATAGLFRFDRSGHLDTSFAKAGVALIENVQNFCCVAVDSQDRIVVAGASFTPDTEQMFVARYTEQGDPDSAFGLSGFAQPIVGIMNSYALGLTLDRHDRPIVVGESDDIGYYSSAALVHFNLDGSLNKALGLDGIYSTPIGLYSSFGTSVLIDALDRPTMSVVARDRLGEVPVLIRYDELFGDGLD